MCPLCPCSFISKTSRFNQNAPYTARAASSRTIRYIENAYDGNMNLLYSY